MNTRLLSLLLVGLSAAVFAVGDPSYPTIIGGPNGRAFTNAIQANGLLPFDATKQVLTLIPYDSTSNANATAYAPYKQALRWTDAGDLTNSATWATNCFMQGVAGAGATTWGYYPSSSNGVGCEACSGQFYYRATMISPRHYVTTSHVGWHEFYQTNGLALGRFLGADGNLYWRKTVGTTNWTEVWGTNGGLFMGVLDADLPATVGYAKLLPTNAWRYFWPSNEVLKCAHAVSPSNGNVWYLLNRRAAERGDWDAAGDYAFGAFLGLANSAYTPCDGCPLVRNAFPWVGVWGDAEFNPAQGNSGNPQFMVISNQVVLVGITSGPAGINCYIPEINGLMHYLSTNYDVGSDYEADVVDLSGYRMIR